jgi:hypothetical protein
MAGTTRSRNNRQGKALVWAALLGAAWALGYRTDHRKSAAQVRAEEGNYED